MSDDTHKLRIAARWGYRSYESETGRRDEAFKDLLCELHAGSECSLAMIALESWDVTKKDFESRFDVETPILYTDKVHIELFRTIALVRTLNDRIARTDPEWGQGHSLAFMHFILGNAARKYAFVVDLAGTEGIDRHKVLRDRKGAAPATGAVDSQRAAAETSHGEAETSPSVIEVLLPQSRLADLRRKHERLRSGIDSILQRNRPEPDVAMATQEAPGIADLSMLVEQADRIADPGETTYYDPDCEILLSLLRELQSDIDSDLKWTLPAATLAQWASGQEHVTEGSSLTGLASAFLRQAFLQAVLVARIHDCPMAIVIPDMSYKVSASGGDMGTVPPGGMETSSLALQFFPRGGMRSAIPDFAFWATLVSIVGRGKTVHDYSMLERERGREMVTMLSFHEVGNLETRVGGPIARLLDKWNTYDDSKKIAWLNEVRANARLAFLGMGVGIAGLWKGEDFLDKKIPVSELKHMLEPAVRFQDRRVTFPGDWASEETVPLTLQIVFANLIRNAVNNNTSKMGDIVIEAKISRDAAEFIVRSHEAMDPHWRQKAFVESHSAEPPGEHFGLWMCREIVEKQCQGEWSLAKETDSFKTNISVRVHL